MDSWLKIHSFIANYLNGFHESCKLAQISKLGEEERLSELNCQATAIQEELGRFKRLSDERRREREALDRTRMRLLS
ncbi:hypothetical protein BDM02DRAFT_3187354 [Thelephora ganbajun]|uniref:Uncharacterized protein n=1 Tax=Thelephora ganbajun TaxID=370292 RepID=A0ACB6ZEL9_THEGA|nr:hypothetical protein BDM02DRAFT_3187354 [Thelephora ganbajun]